MWQPPSFLRLLPTNVGIPSNSFHFLKLSYQFAYLFLFPSWPLWCFCHGAVWASCFLTHPFCSGSSMPSVFVKELPSSLLSGVFITDISNHFLGTLFSWKTVPFFLHSEAFEALYVVSPMSCSCTCDWHLLLYSQSMWDFLWLLPVHCCFSFISHPCFLAFLVVWSLP